MNKLHHLLNCSIISLKVGSSNLKQKTTHRLSRHAPIWMCYGRDYADTTSSLGARQLSLLDQAEQQEFIQSFDTVLTDCDGVLWKDNVAIPNTPEVISRLQNMGKKVYYVTNNSTKTRAECVQRCRQLGYRAHENDVMVTTYLVAKYLQSLDFKKTAYVIGSPGLCEQLELLGIKHIWAGRESGVPPDVSSWVRRGAELESGVGAVVVAFDEHFSYAKLLKAASYLRDPECLFVATNSDQRFPISSPAVVMPATGALLAAVESASDRKAVVVGKPNPYICEVLKREQSLDPRRTLMIGDNASTDVLLGRNCGFQTLAVMSGVTSVGDLEKWSKSSCEEERRLVADFYLHQLGDMLPLLQH